MNIKDAAAVDDGDYDRNCFSPSTHTLQTRYGNQSYKDKAGQESRDLNF